MGVRSFIIRRLLLTIPTIVGVSMLIFAVTMMLSPTARASLYVRSERQLRFIDELIETHGLNRPFYEQYYRWLTQLLQGNLGWARYSSEPVTQAIMNRLPATFELVIFSAPITIFLGIYFGSLSAANKDKIIDHMTRTLSIAGGSLPSFWWAIILMSIFYAGLGWFPPERLGFYASMAIRSSGYIRYTGLNTLDGLLNGQLWITADALRHLVLPCAVLSTIQVATLLRVMRSSMLESLGKGYITMARAKGLTEKEVLNKHARRNALIPVVTLSGLLIAGMLTGVVITETVFNINGIGKYAAAAAVQLDIAVVLGFAMFSAVVFIVSNLAVDVLYAYIDPRIRLD